MTDMTEAIKALEKLLSKVESEEWVFPLAHRYILTGIRMSIKYLQEGKRE